MNSAPASALRVHATAALATKLGGFTANPAPADADPLPLDTWYAHLVRRRKPRVMVMNATTLMTVIVPLAPAATFLQRLPGHVAAQLGGLLIPPQFIHEHVDRLHGGGAILKTADRTLVGILNRRLLELDYWDARSEEEWDELAFRFTDTITLAVGEPTHGLDRLFNVVHEWETRQVY